MQKHDVNFELTERFEFHSKCINNKIERNSIYGLFKKPKPNSKARCYHGNAGNNYCNFVYLTLLNNPRLAKQSLLKAVDNIEKALASMDQEYGSAISFALFLSSITKNESWSKSLAERLMKLKAKHGRYFDRQNIDLLISALWLEDKKSINTYLDAVVKDENKKKSLLLTGTSSAIQSFLENKSDEAASALEKMLAHHIKLTKNSRSLIYGSVDVFLPKIPNILCNLFEQKGMSLKKTVSNNTQNITFSTFSRIDYFYLTSKDKFNVEIELLWSDEKLKITNEC